jgi:vacuolar-type H+-ATPase subunit F/Vma7
MGAVAAIGEETRIRGFTMVGALVLPAEDAQAVRDAWRSLPPDVEVVILTAAADEALADRDRALARPLVAVMA